MYALLGEVCQQLGRTQEAVRHFNTALDLEPKDSGAVKVSMHCSYCDGALLNMFQACLERIDEPDMQRSEVDVL